MFAAASVFAPLMAIFTTGESAIASLNVAVIVREVPAFTGPFVEYVIAAVGDVLSRVKVTGVPGAVLPPMSVPIARTVYVPSVSDDHVGSVALLVHVTVVVPSAVAA